MQHMAAAVATAAISFLVFFFFNSFFLPCSSLPLLFALSRLFSSLSSSRYLLLFATISFLAAAALFSLETSEQLHGEWHCQWVCVCVPARLFLSLLSGSRSHYHSAHIHRTGWRARRLVVVVVVVSQFCSAQFAWFSSSIKFFPVLSFSSFFQLFCSSFSVLFALFSFVSFRFAAAAAATSTPLRFESGHPMLRRIPPRVSYCRPGARSLGHGSGIVRQPAIAKIRLQTGAH